MCPPFLFAHTDFNPRSRKESDHFFSSSRIVCYDFNPRSRKESDFVVVKLTEGVKVFQSTLSQGERHVFFLCPVPSPVISIHALARRATPSAVRLHCRDFIFQSTLSQGERQPCLTVCIIKSGFQSTLSQGERQMAFWDFAQAT